jgi:spore maturation protein CgeB
MANILIIHFGGVLVDGKYRTFIFYEGLIDALRKNGNNVIEIITNDFLERPWSGSNKLKPGINRIKLIKEIIKFNPKLVISFNNSSIEGLEDEVSCPIVVWDADHFYHFNDLDKLKANKERYLFFCSQSSDIADCQKILGVNREKCSLVKPATSIKSDLAHKKTSNIIFIGTPFDNNSEKEKLHKYKKDYVELTKQLIHDKSNLEDLVYKYKKIPKVEQTILDFGSVANRTNTLAHVAPLGLNIHGGDGWLDIGLDSSLDIFKGYNPKHIYSMAQTQEAYNSSKIGLNINHAQAKSGYSWRVMDILASSAVLVSNYSKDLAEDLGDIGREVFYSNPQEAYELCLKFSSNEHLRRSVVQRSNEIVRKFHTWEIRLGEIEAILKIKLTNQQAAEGEYIVLDAKKYQEIFSAEIIKLNNIALSFSKNFAQTIIYGLAKIFVAIINIMLGLIRFVTPYGIVKLTRVLRTNLVAELFKKNHYQKELKFPKLSLKNFYKKLLRFCYKHKKDILIIIIRLISPYGFVEIYRFIKNR